MKFRFAINGNEQSAIDDPVQVQRFSAALRRSDARGRLRVTEEIRQCAGDQIARFARARALQFGRPNPNLDDFAFAGRENPALLTIWAGDIARDSDADVG